MKRSLGSLIVVGTTLTLFSGVAVVMFVAAATSSAACDPTSGQGVQADRVDLATVPQGPIAGYSGVQLKNAAHILNAAAELSLSARDQRIGLMTAMGESGLRVLTHGDAAGPDSRGLFQQRANGAWGTEADRMDPRISSLNFFKALMRVEGRDTLQPTIAAHRVQGNADPYHYTPYWAPAGEVQAALLGGATSAPAPPAGEDPYNLGAVKPALRALVHVLAPKFGIRVVGGYRASATDPNGHPAGLAADFMTTSLAQGDRLAAYAKTNAASLGVDYILWKQRIWSVSRAAEGWRPMEDRGSETANHFDHVHINVKPEGGDGTTADPVHECVSNPTHADGQWVVPVEGAAVTSPYGWRTHPITGSRSFHDGADYGAGCGTSIRSASSGVVVSAAWDAIYGHQVIVEHSSGVRSRYAHMYASGVHVTTGDSVTTGQSIAQVGSAGASTGCHLHFTIWVQGETTDPVAFLNNANATPAIASGAPARALVDHFRGEA